MDKKECMDKLGVYENNDGSFIAYTPIHLSKWLAALENWDFFTLFTSGQIIVQISYKYKHEKDYTIDNEIIYSCSSDRDKWCWISDWDEGQYMIDNDAYVLGWINLDDVTINSIYV